MEEALAEVQRVDAKAQSAFDLKKQNLKDETKKRNELVKSMEEVKGNACAHVICCDSQYYNYNLKIDFLCF